MSLVTTPSCDSDFFAKDFDLLGVDGCNHTLEEIRGRCGTLVMFICNHCPYVQAIVSYIVETAEKLIDLSFGVVAIMPNDTVAYPDDSFENMKLFAQKYKFPFPYLIDEKQDITRAYDAVCTPDFFIFDGSLKLRYRGCLINKINRNNDLLKAAEQISKYSNTTIKQYPSIGCSIKWRNCDI